MHIIINLILFVLILGIIVFVHEFGHFIFAKLMGVYVYEFSIGMGPRLFGWKSKNGETDYNVRLIPIGGFCSLAGEDVENDDKSIKKDRKLQAKKPWQRFLIMFMGPGFNFLLALIIFFFIGLIGAPSTEPILYGTVKNYPAYSSGLSKGDLIKSINGHNIYTMDDVSLYLAVADHKKPVSIKVEKKDGSIKTYNINSKKKTVKVSGQKQTTYKYGISLKTKTKKGLGNAISYMFVKTGSLFRQMFITAGYLFTGKVGLNDLSGPVGIYSIVGEEASQGFAALVYLLAYLSINVGFLNLLPLPAFDGGHILFIIIELIKGSPVKPETEAKVHTVGFALLMILMIVITINDILRFF